MTTWTKHDKLFLPERFGERQPSPKSIEDRLAADVRALEAWAEKLLTVGHTHGHDADLTGVSADDHHPEVRYLGRANLVGTTWSNAVADGFEEWGGGVSGNKGITVTKVRADTLFVIHVHFAGFTGTGTCGFNAKITEDGASDVDAVIPMFKNAANDHASFGFTVQSTALSAASHTFKLMIDATSGTFQTDASNDHISWEVWEVKI